MASNSSREVPRAVTVPESSRNSNADKGNSSPEATNAASRNNAPAASALNSTPKPAATPIASPVPSPTAKLPSPTPAQKSSPAVAQSSTNEPPPATTSQQRQDRWSRMKERVNYWILMAQLNPVPVATGVGLLLCCLGCFFFSAGAQSPWTRAAQQEVSECGDDERCYR